MVNVGKYEPSENRGEPVVAKMDLISEDEYLDILSSESLKGNENLFRTSYWFYYKYAQPGQ